MTPLMQPPDNYSKVSIEELAKRIEAGELTMPQLYKKLKSAGATPDRSTSLMAKVLLEMVKRRKYEILI